MDHMWTSTRGRASPAHVAGCGQGKGSKIRFFVDVINGWPLIPMSSTEAKKTVIHFTKIYFNRSHMYHVLVVKENSGFGNKNAKRNLFEFCNGSLHFIVTL